MAKRAFDVGMVLLMAVPVLMVCVLVAVAIKLTSRGPVLYWSKRIGVNSRTFLMPKFRTMRTDTPDVATHLLSNPAQWLTPIGSFLRKSSLDELPQLLSVLRGDMSTVGPRPALHNQTDLIDARRSRGIDALRPGITGWAQINGRDEMPTPVKIEYDHQYMLRQSIVFDLEILLATAVKVLRRTGVTH